MNEKFNLYPSPRQGCKENSVNTKILTGLTSSLVCNNALMANNLSGWMDECSIMRRFVWMERLQENENVKS